jgi:tRNA(Ile2) C34 agmatinyltransferase TiaS
MSESGFTFADFRDMELRREMSANVYEREQPPVCETCGRELDDAGWCECCGHVTPRGPV